MFQIYIDILLIVCVIFGILKLGMSLGKINITNQTIRQFLMSKYLNYGLTVIILIVSMYNKWYYVFFLLVCYFSMDFQYKHLWNKLKYSKEYPFTMKVLPIAAELFIGAMWLSNIILQVTFLINLVGIIILWKMGIDIYADEFSKNEE